MFNSPGQPTSNSSFTKAPPQGSIPQPGDDGFHGEMVPDWNNIGLFGAGIAVGAILGAAVALLFAPAPGDVTRGRIARRVRHPRGEDDVWDELAEELELAAAEAEEEQEAAAAAAKD
jgi:hypothetical protein